MTAALSIRRVTSSDQADYIEVRIDDENGRRVAAATMSLEAFGLAVTGRSEIPVELAVGAPSPSPGLAAQEVERLREAGMDLVRDARIPIGWGEKAQYLVSFAKVEALIAALVAPPTPENGEGEK